jgi:hypothetical protein
VLDTGNQLGEDFLALPTLRRKHERISLAPGLAIRLLVFRWGPSPPQNPAGSLTNSESKEAAMPRSALRVGRWLPLVLLLALVAFPAQSAPKQRPVVDRKLDRLSQAVVTRRWIDNPSQAPAPMRARFQALHDSLARARGARRSAPTKAPTEAPTGPAILADRFNQDLEGLPQNEESVTACRSNPNIVLGGTNDYRGLVDPQGNLTGWHLSRDGGATVANEGLLPAISVGGAEVPSGGDPVDVAGSGCKLYAGSLNYGFSDPTGEVSAIGAYRSDWATLANCPGGSSTSCWPTRRPVAVAEPGHFLDKEWLHVGHSGAAGEVVWVTYTDFDFQQGGSSIKAVRCTADLSSCTAPITVSGGGEFVETQFSDVTVGPDGRTYVSWAESSPFGQAIVIKLRVAEPGSTTFGPERLVASEPLAMTFSALHAGDFRVATYPKHEVRMVGGKPRVYVVWDACRARVQGFACEEPVIKLRSSDDLGAGWSFTKILSTGGDNYFPTISDDRAGGSLAVAWFTNRFDPIFHNRQDVELVSVNPTTGAVTKRQRVTSPSNEPEADPFLGGFFIGDYIEVFAHSGTALVHYNANYASVPFFGEAFAVPQQDNYLSRRPL